jgi:hypothetical protein
MAAADKPDSGLTNRCDKCGNRLPRPTPTPALCGKCELVNRLTVERYTRHERSGD